MAVVWSAVWLSTVTMIFTLPGAMMLISLQATLRDRGWPRATGNVAVLAVGAVTGSALLGFFSTATPQAGGIGALYALTTGVMLLLMKAISSADPWTA